MKTQKTFTNGADLAVLVRGSGFYYAIRRFVGEAIEARRKRVAVRRTAEELAQLPDYLKQDINWPAIDKHKED
ncbi:MAG: hypothetical protein WA950_09770 [Shinella sp.]|uniref:hypothetical protein n=1 Tax=Shinella sp. TaxID=1870904 RepID=UPI003C74532E